MEVRIRLGELIKGLDGAHLAGSSETVIENIEYDSRLIKSNALFFAIQGFKQDGFAFVDDALARGAVAVMGERDTCPQTENYVRVNDIRQAMSTVSARMYGYPGTKMKICGVTGTNGKTTTSFLIKKMLESAGKRTGLVTTQVYDTGTETFDAERTTPESLDLQRLLFLMKKNQCTNAVVEVSSHALALKRVDNIVFRVAVYTNFTRDHLDFHKTMEEYLAAKALLLDKLDGQIAYAVINRDVPEFQQLFGRVAASYITFSSTTQKADIHCGSVDYQPNRTIFDLMTPMGSRTVEYHLPGKFNLANALAAAAGGLATGVTLDEVVRGLEAAKPVPGRLNYISAGQPFAVYDDFAHTPDALLRLCESARVITKGRILLLFGCGGDKDKGKRPLMGEAATTSADFVIVTSDNPRSENPLDIIEQIKPGLRGKNYKIIPDRTEAIVEILKMAKPGDAVLLAGKGAERYQEIMGVKHPHNDSDAAYAALSAMGYPKTQVVRGR